MLEIEPPVPKAPFGFEVTNVAPLLRLKTAFPEAPIPALILKVLQSNVPPELTFIVPFNDKGTEALL